MIVQLYVPKSLSPSRLDSYMASGWFRSSYMLYRSEVMCISEDVREVINIRLNLERHTFKKNLRKLLNQNDKRFTTTVQLLELNEEKERLYQQQKGKFKGFIFDKLAHFFNVFPENAQGDTIFETYEVCVYDADKLVAVSFFDVGRKCVVSLLGLYDMNYTKYSLGTYTMLREIQFGQETNRKFYYPGYIIGGDNAFDYKLRIGTFQYYDWRGWWKGMHKLPLERGNVTLYKERMQELEEALIASEVSFKKILYPFFSFGYLSFGVKNPSFFAINYDKNADVWLAVGYLVEDDCYTVCFIRQYMDVEVPNMTCTTDFYENDLYCMKMLDYEEIILETSNCAQAVAKIKEMEGVRVEG
ncbi:MAG: hypothetical protein EAZ95_09345 [Bacteroidetes bacterium]|nr:MAG: hypothetical protein EAZ95_09345 [Bacteroidota bacterium]